MKKHLVSLVFTTFMNGLLVSLGYATLMEKIPEFSILFLVLMFAHVIITSYIIAHGFLYNELRYAVEYNLKELIHGYIYNLYDDDEGGTLYQQYKGKK